MRTWVTAAGTLAAFIPAAAEAQVARAHTTAPMLVTAEVLSACTVAAQPLAFGTLALNGGDNDSQTTITLTCTPGVTYDVGLDNGAHAANGTRNMAGTLNGSVIPYRVYSNATRTTEWGNTIGTNTVNGRAQNVVTNLTVYGRVPANASLFAAGGYTDTVTVTLTF